MTGDQISVFEILNSKNYSEEEIDNYLENATNDLVSYAKTNVKTSLVQQLENESHEVDKFLWKQNIFSNKISLQAYLLGQMKSRCDFANEIKSNIHFSLSADVLFSEYKNIDKVMNVLYSGRPVNHKTLAKSVGISVPSLTNLFTRVEKYNLYDKRKIGRQHIYIITKNGRSLFEKRFQEKEPVNDSLTELVLEVLNIVTYEVSSTSADSDRMFKRLMNISATFKLGKPDNYKYKLKILANQVNKIKLLANANQIPNTKTILYGLNAEYNLKENYSFNLDYESVYDDMSSSSVVMRAVN